MAPSRGKGKAALKTPNSSDRGKTRNSTSGERANAAVPGVYRSLLEEVDEHDVESVDRPLKRRKVGRRAITPDAQSDVQSPIDVDVGLRDIQGWYFSDRFQVTSTVGSTADTLKSGKPLREYRSTAVALQTVEESSEDDASDLEFEDVDFAGAAKGDSDAGDGIEDLTITIEAESSAINRQNQQYRRKPPTIQEKAQRLLIHKLNIVCLMGHCMYVNGRCKNATVQKHLRPLLADKTISYLNPRADDTQFQRNRSFLDGLQQAATAFKSEFRVLAGGLFKPQWEVGGDSGHKYDMGPPLERVDFISAAKVLEGSQDTGNQLFCAMLRSVGLNARMMCSLQVLPFTSLPKPSTPKKPVKVRALAIAADGVPVHDNNSTYDATVRGSRSVGSVPAARRRLGQPAFSAESSKVVSPKKTKLVPKLSFPVFWVEAFNEAQQKWIAVDPIVTHTVGKPSQLEPPASYELNQLLYVIAFEEDGTARDVTKRYAKAYNAKTRRHRLEASVDGARWYKKAMRIFRRRGGALDRDQVEDSELAQKEAREGMPNNVQDFKDHPYYALERHLKRHEVIHPKREVGKVNAGSAAKPRMESIYRRQDVLICRSADKWYRLGREIQEGEQPLKHVPARAARPATNEDEDVTGLAAMTALYAAAQTSLYLPPPVKSGRIPKNVYGNLDIYVPSMVPNGGLHIRHELAQQAARLLRIDYADAVTGFKFQGRHGTAVMEGVVVAEQYGNAVHAVIEELENGIVEDASKARSLAALRLWKRFLAGLRIAARVSTYTDTTLVEDETVGDTTEDQNEGGHLLEVDDDPLQTAGQYTIHELSGPAKRKIKRKQIDHTDDEIERGDELSQHENEESGGFIVEDATENMSPGGDPAQDNGGEGGFLPSSNSDKGLAADLDGTNGGFFIEEVGGGFITEDENITSGIDSEEDLFENATDVPTDTAAGTNGASPKGHSEVVESVASAVGSLHDAANDNMSEQLIRSGVADVDIMETDTTSPGRSVESSQAVEDEVLEVGQKPSSTHDESESDKASMLSHDPDDDDAEPDWLDSD